MSTRLRRVVPFLLAAFALIIADHQSTFAQATKPAAASTKQTPSAPPAGPAPAGAANVMAPTSAEVKGFRSAKFGMNDAEVRAAIAKDFGFKGDTVREQPNPAERTTVIVIKAPDVLPGGGAAEISYVFGYESKKLIQVSVSWSKATDDKMTPEQLFSNSSVLRTHFLAEGYKPDTVATNMPINNGILLFRGSDASDRTTMLILQGTMSQGQNDQRVLTPTALQLFYIADAKTPDVYRLPPGSF